MTTYNDEGTHIIPREITFNGIELPAKRAVSIIMESGVERAVTFNFTYNEYSDDVLVEIYWYVGEVKHIGFYGRIEGYYPTEVIDLGYTGFTEFIMLPTTLGIEEIVDNQVKKIKMSPRLWIYEVDAV